MMNTVSSLLLVSLFAAPVFAQKIKVEKVKGSRAVVQFVGSLAPGETYDLGGDTESSAPGKAGSRKNLLGISGELSSLSTSVGGSTTSSTVFAVSARYGWNMVNSEYGGLVSFANVSGSGFTSTSYLLGGFFDFNLIPHRSTAEMVYGIGGEAGFGSGSSTGGSAVTTVSLYPMGFLKWFFLKTTTCARIDVGYKYQTYQTSPDAQTVSGLKAQVGLAHYF